MNVPPLIAAVDRLTFAEPRLLALAGLIPALVILRVLGSRRKERGLRRMVAAGLRPKLVFGDRPGRDLAVFFTEIVGLALIVTALARPQFGETEREALSEGRNLIIGIDTSRSMLATDLEPDRLTRAKLAARDLIDELPNDRIGIMAFAGNAVLQVPLTIDHAASGETLDQLDIYSIEQGGSDLGGAIDLAVEQFGKIAADRNALILFTDGEDLAGKGLDAAEKAAEEGILIITVGVGSTLGSILPDAGSQNDAQFIRDRSGELVKSRLDVESLEKIAARTHGMFINLNARSMNAELVDSMLNQLDTTRDERNARTVPVERYQWPLGVGTFLLVLAFVLPSFRRARDFFPGGSAATSAAVLGFLGALTLMPSAARAGTAEDAWRAYNDKNYTDAVDLYGEALGETRSGEKRARLEFGRGAAAYRAGDLDTALDSYAQSLLSADDALRENSHYNLGNTLFRRGEKALQPAEAGKDAAAASPGIEPVLADWKSAAQHYDDALALNPSNESARRNAEIVRERIEQLEEQQKKNQEDEEQKKEEQEQKQDEPKEQEKKDENEEEKKEEEQQEKEKENEEQKDGQEEESEDGESKEEEQGEQDGDEQKKEEGEGQQPEENPEGKDGEKSEEQEQPSQDGEESAEKREGEREGEGDSEEAGEAGEEKPGEEKQAALSEDEKVNPETGYSKMDAERILRMLSDEQYDMTPLRRRVRSRNIDDW